jgi:ATP-dependent RNA helicase SUPV3L1/SUV3
MEHLASARCGAYLAPLRLLALENYERLQEKGVRVSLVTGEEQRLDPAGTHVASTVEMANFTRRLDVAVIDEVQLLADPERGGAWVAAICGIPADIVYLVGAPAAKPALEALANRLNVELEVRMLERKSPLHVLDTPISSLKDLKPGDALIAFSRRNVLEWAENASRCGLSVATIYGNLSPETRRPASGPSGS